MIPISYLFEQPQELPPEEQGNLADRIYVRALERVPTPEQDEEAAISDEAAAKIEQEKQAAKVAAATAEMRNRDPELKQLKAAEAIHNKQAAEDVKSLEQGAVPPNVEQDKAEQAAAMQGPPEGNSQGQVQENLFQYI
jgi:hypothetical protein